MDASMDACFATLKDRWGTLDFVVHAIAYSDKHELTGRFINTTRERFPQFADDQLLFLHRTWPSGRPSIGCRRGGEPDHGGGGDFGNPTPPLTYQGVEPRDAPGLLQRDGRGKGGAGNPRVRYLANDLGPVISGGHLYPSPPPPPQAIRVNAISPGAD